MLREFSWDSLQPKDVAAQNAGGLSLARGVSVPDLHSLDASSERTRLLLASGLRAGGEETSSTRPSTPSRISPMATLTGLLASNFSAPLQDCVTLESLHRAAIALVPRASQQQVAFDALAAAVGRRACQLLRRCCGTVESAWTSLSVVADLRREELLGQVENCRDAVASALCALLAERSRRPAARSRAPRRGLSPPRPCRAVATWAQHAQLVATACTESLLAPEHMEVLAELLEASLRRSLHGATAKDLKQDARRLRAGSGWLAMAVSVAAGADEKAAAERARLAQTAVSAAAFDALRVAEGSLDAPDSADARAALRDAGFVDPASASDREPEQRPPSRPVSRGPISAAPARKAGAPLRMLPKNGLGREESALELGLRRVEAMRADLRGLRGPLRSRQGIA
mmetsp:Transcript_17841/g.39106  ORF Transcript_17841/g.39106 Transcript_17841/m.39106 type:complete len:401 (-) Transcript_17841:167-1369(-)